MTCKSVKRGVRATESYRNPWNISKICHTCMFLVRPHTNCVRLDDWKTCEINKHTWKQFSHCPRKHTILDDNIFCIFQMRGDRLLKHTPRVKPDHRCAESRVAMRAVLALSTPHWKFSFCFKINLRVGISRSKMSYQCRKNVTGMEDLVTFWGKITKTFDWTSHSMCNVLNIRLTELYNASKHVCWSDGFLIFDFELEYFLIFIHWFDHDPYNENVLDLTPKRTFSDRSKPKWSEMFNI